MIIRSKAPLRLGFAGGGTDVSPYSDVHGGYVLNATIDMYAYCTLEPLDECLIQFNLTDKAEVFIQKSLAIIELDGKFDLHKGVYNYIMHTFNDDVFLPVRITTYSDAPAGSGLGSSSTLVVAMMKAYAEWLNIPLGDYDIAYAAYIIEREYVGLAGGKQDQYAATFGGFNFIEFYKDDRVIVNPLRIKQWIVNELEGSLVLYFTGVSRDSARIIKDQVDNYNNGDLLAIESMHELKKDALKMKEAILRGNIAEFANNLNKSWASKKNMAGGITNKLIETAYETAFANGALAGKVSGAGGGGFMMFIVDPSKKMDVIYGLKKLGGYTVNCHFVIEGAVAWRI